MTAPSCPQDYSCTFTLVHPRIIEHSYGPWYNSPGGIVAMAIGAVLAISLFAVLVTRLLDDHQKKLERLDEAKERTHKLAVEEQHTLQLDMAKGDHELLRILKADK